MIYISDRMEVHVDELHWSYIGERCFTTQLKAKAPQYLDRHVTSSTRCVYVNK